MNTAEHEIPTGHILEDQNQMVGVLELFLVLINSKSGFEIHFWTVPQWPIIMNGTTVFLLPLGDSTATFHISTAIAVEIDFHFLVWQ